MPMLANRLLIPTFTTDKFGEIVKKRWIIGQSIVTVEQATRGGWAQITKRQPSGTSCYIIREKFTRPPPHQTHIPHEVMREGRNADTNVVLPSHLLLQLMASAPQSTESLRPIALLDDETTRRAISSFDLNSTVDSHKVGVIYIGENQDPGSRYSGRYYGKQRLYRLSLGHRNSH